MSQQNDILHHLRKIGPLTPLEALKLYGCFRLASRIKELREKGHPIETIRLDVEDGKTVAQYMLRDDDASLHR